ncbi:transcriptional regulator [Candidatus Thiomargarita nelsonii]|uniref:Transcriptional regulator n=1 Tax=Candidatus Thiomargarita nelsonii TaxID=1003181 RepID=A0A0A6PAI4_9GAMM|nr:transcriptional regulator [Candidatus Thiomargarita nelsonii]
MPEKQDLEWKTSWRDEYLKWICGFANAKGGIIYLGKDDNGNIVGLDDYKRLMDDIPNKIQNHLGILCEINLHESAGKYYIEIDVKPYDVPISYQGKYHYRSGSTKQELKGSVLNEFLLKKAGKTWDDVIEPNATYTDIDENSINVFKQEAARTQRLPAIVNENDNTQIFENLRLLEDGKLKRAAVLLFGKEPCKFFINAYAKIGKFGNSDHDLQSQEIVEGNTFQLADQLIEILDKKYFIKTISYDGLHRVEMTPYPFEAIREALINAIIHRDYFGPPIQISIYNDKIIIWNVGELPESITIEDLKRKHASYPRNPRLADVFFKGGLIEAWGRGTLKIINECIQFGLPEPDIELMSGGIAVTIYKNFYCEEVLNKYDLNSRQFEALLRWRDKGFITTGVYKDYFNLSDRTALRDLTQLVDIKLVRKNGDKKSTKYLYKK